MPFTTSQRSRATTPKREAVESEVLQAVKDLLAEGASFNDLDVGRIAQRAGISRTAFYFYFADKRELLKRVTEEVMALLYEQAERWWSGTGDGRADLEAALRNTSTLWRDNAPVIRAVIEVSGYDAEAGAFWRSVIARFVDATTNHLEQEWGPGEHAPSAAATAHMLCWMTERVYYQGLFTPGDTHWGPLADGVVAMWHRTIYDAR